MDLRARQKPLKERYRQDPESSRITLVARAAEGETPIACSVDLGRTIYDAQAHPGVGGAGTAACSGDLLLGALAACAQLTCQMVAAAMEIPVADVQVTVEGDLDLSGTLGVVREAQVGFEAIRLRFDIDAPEATEEQLAALLEKTERYCVVLQTLTNPPRIETGAGGSCSLSGVLSLFFAQQTRRDGVPRYLVERQFHVGQERMPEVGRRSRQVIEEHFPEVAWEHSVDEGGGVKTFCLYEAPSEDVVRQHANQLGLHNVEAIYEIAGDVTPADFPTS